MLRYACMIQADQSPHRNQVALEAGLRKIGAECFGDDPEETQFQWIVLEQGWAWTAGEPSTSSLVVRSVPVGLADDPREAFMRRVCDLWKSETGSSIDEIVVTAWDGPLPL
jgi:hypothetical protein